MITRAQAEALLTLAESLEACERQGVIFSVEDNRLEMFYGERGIWAVIDDVSPMRIRLAVNALIPKQET